MCLCRLCSFINNGRWKASSRSSRETIEGFKTTRSEQEKHQRKLCGISLPFFSKNDVSKQTDCENGQLDDKAQRSTKSEDRANSLPEANKYMVANENVTIFVNNEKVSDLTQGTASKVSKATESNSPSYSAVNKKKTESFELSSQGYKNQALEETI